MISNDLKKCYQKGAESFGWHRRNHTLASIGNGDWRLGIGISGGIYGYGKGRGIVAALFSDGCLILYGIEKKIDPASEASLTRVAKNTFNIKPENILFVSNITKIDRSWSMEIHDKVKQQYNVVTESLNLLQQKIKQIAVTGSVKMFSGIAPEELIISNGFLKNYVNNKIIPIPQLLEQNDLKVVEVRIAQNYYIQEQSHISLNYAAHFVEIMMQPDEGKIKLSKMVAVIDAGKIQDLMAVASHLNNALNIEFDKIAIKNVTDKNLNIEMYQGFSSFMNTLLAERPVTEIIFIKPTNTIGERQSANLSELTNLHLNGFSCALQNAIHHATGWRVCKS